MAKWIASTYPGVIVCDGKKENIFNQVNMMMESGVIPQIIIMDIPRTMEDKLHMGTIEALKNGMLYSGKYEGGLCMFAHPHVIAFANFEPPKKDLSKDRWIINKLE